MQAMARRTERQDKAMYHRQLEKNQAREDVLRDLQHEKKMAGYYDEAIKREEAVCRTSRANSLILGKLLIFDFKIMIVLF